MKFYNIITIFFFLMNTIIASKKKSVPSVVHTELTNDISATWTLNFNTGKFEK